MSADEDRWERHLATKAALTGNPEPGTKPPCGPQCCTYPCEEYRARPREWRLPAEPGPEVTAVRCGCHGTRWQLVYAPPAGAWSPRPDATEQEFLSWRYLLIFHDRLTDATADAINGAQT